MLNRTHIGKNILLALIAGVLLASASISISYSCPLLPGESGCVRYEKALMHPMDLASNVQGSLVRFLFDLLIGFLLTLAILIALNKFQERKRLGFKS